MIAKGFKPVLWVGAVGGAALICYMLSLQVASERSELAGLEQHILRTQQEIRSLQTELGTRGRLQQLELWNAEVLALSAPRAGQFLDSNVALARFDTQAAPSAPESPVRLASAPAPGPAPSSPAPAVALAAARTPPAVTPGGPVRRASLEILPGPAATASAGVAPAPSQRRTAAVTGAAPRRPAASPRAPEAGSSPRPRPAAAAPAQTRAEAGLLDSSTLRELGTRARSEGARPN